MSLTTILYAITMVTGIVAIVLTVKIGVQIQQDIIEQGTMSKPDNILIIYLKMIFLLFAYGIIGKRIARGIQSKYDYYRKMRVALLFYAIATICISLIAFHVEEWVDFLIDV